MSPEILSIPSLLFGQLRHCSKQRLAKQQKIYVELAYCMLDNFQELGGNMNIKVRFLQSHFGRFTEKLGNLFAKRKLRGFTRL